MDSSEPIITLTQIELNNLISHAVKSAMRVYNEQVVLPLKAEFETIKGQNSLILKKLDSFANNNQSDNVRNIDNTVKKYSNVVKTSNQKRQIEVPAHNTEVDKDNSKVISKPLEENASNLLRDNVKVQTDVMNKVIQINSDINVNNETAPDRQSASDGDWQKPKTRKNKLPSLTTGTCKSECTLKGVAKRLNFHVSRLHPSTSVPQIVNHLINSNIADPHVEKLSSKYPTTYSSFRISILPEFKDTLLMPTTWPVGTCVNRFFLECSPAQSNTVNNRLRTKLIFSKHTYMIRRTM
ncbi:hypothetical protein PPYR_06113 [Photinus pyralis]|uniref:Uncharacterized protein n=1 Tax=Photinus pyralis TaxID=7054 RepID=A0A5N4ASW6_PHOPY|nr:hypothetical protein PPYR_06113 [Photinus pyralis]